MDGAVWTVLLVAQRWCAMYDEWKPVRFTTDEAAVAAAEAAGDIELPESSSEDEDGDGETVPVHHETMPVLPIEIWLLIMRCVLIQYEYGLYVLAPEVIRAHTTSVAI